MFEAVKVFVIVGVYVYVPVNTGVRVKEWVAVNVGLFVTVAVSVKITVAVSVAVPKGISKAEGLLCLTHEKDKSRTIPIKMTFCSRPFILIILVNFTSP